jgi:hypothetical protein
MVLPLDLVPLANSGLFSAFRIKGTDGRLGIDFALYRRQMAAEADRKRRFEAWFEDRGISTKFADRDGRFEEILAASRAHWGLNHQGQPTAGKT